MVQYIEKYEDEEFIVSGEHGECALTVTHRESGRYATVSPGQEGESKFAYRLDNGGAGKHRHPEAL